MPSWRNIFKKSLFCFKKLGIKNVYHSAPTNLILNLLYGHEINFFPRYIVDRNFKSKRYLDYKDLKQ